MSEVVRRESYLPAGPVGRVDRPTMKVLIALRGAALIGEAEEVVAARRANRRLVEGKLLTANGMLAVAELDDLGTLLSRDKPALELELRSWEQAFGVGGKQTVVRFMTRPQ